MAEMLAKPGGDLFLKREAYADQNKAGLLVLENGERFFSPGFTDATWILALVPAAAGTNDTELW